MPTSNALRIGRPIASAIVVLAVVASLAAPDVSASVESRSNGARLVSITATATATGAGVVHASHRRKRWRTCSHLAPWNRVDYRGGRGAIVVKARGVGCRRAARVLRRSRVNRAGTVRARGWRCRSVGKYAYGGSYSKCWHRHRGRRQVIKIMVGR